MLDWQISTEPQIAQTNIPQTVAVQSSFLHVLQVLGRDERNFVGFGDPVHGANGLARDRLVGVDEHLVIPTAVVGEHERVDGIIGVMEVESDAIGCAK